MNETFISFYLKSNRIHIFVDALRKLGSPDRICFMISENGQSLLVAPYQKKDFKSHSVPKKVYSGSGKFEVNSYKLCRLLAQLFSWDYEKSYRVPGVYNQEHNVVLLDLTGAEEISREAENTDPP